MSRPNKQEATPMSGIPQLHRIPAQKRVKPGFRVTAAEQTKGRIGQEAAGVRGAFYIRHGKRVFDVIGAAVALIIGSPILFLCAVAVMLESRGPVFFRQWRVGKNGEPFLIFKLRTMIHGADKRGPKITASGDCRITRVGRILRKTKMDELPQLFNVLRGEMSLVGPRPEVPEYTLKYTLAERKILDVKPGITGPASLTHINEEQLLAGRTDKEHFYVTTIMRRKLEIDLTYCRNISLFEDLKNILLTAGALFIPGGSQTKSLENSPHPDGGAAD
jgi:lipopolysaccharide/colanic/teichoic acid biosynthesis glycosyltransferase